MSLRLVGTGAADGWPTPFCACASCSAERASGRVRAQAAALLDGEVLLDCGPSTPLAAERLGISLAGVRLLLWTHQHSDHFSPATLMYRAWTDPTPLLVAGPPDVVGAARDWVAPGTPVTFRPVRPGDVFEHAGHTVRVLASSHCTHLGTADDPDSVLYDVTGRSGLRVLYATDTGPLPAATLDAARDAAYDVVVLEESFGDWLDHGTRHLDLATFPEEVRRLRAAGAVGPSTRVVATHLSHHNPPTPELARRLAAWGAEVLDDGAEVGVRDGSARDEGVEAPRGRTLVLGGARSGKSREAERLLAAEPEVVYVATSYPAGPDPEWRERIEHHRERRPRHWQTQETLDLVALLQADGPPVLVDCLTLWLTRVMDRHDAWDDEAWHDGARAAVAAEVAALVQAWRTTRRRVVAVTNEVGQGVVPEGAGSRRFRDEMGRLNAVVAAASEEVLLCVAGRVVAL